MVNPVIQFSLKYFISSMCGLNCVHTLQQGLVAYSPSLLYYSQILAMKAIKDLSIQFSQLQFYNVMILALKSMFSLFFLEGGATEIIKQNLLLFQ